MSKISIESDWLRFLVKSNACHRKWQAGSGARADDASISKRWRAAQP